MDSLDLTIDSVARNFGTNSANANQNFAPSPNPNANNHANNNKSLSVSVCSPLSVTAISSPASILHSPSVNSPTSKQQVFKRQKSNNLTNRSMSNLGNTDQQQQQQHPPPSNASLKKRKKTLDSSSSDISLNSSVNKSNKAGGDLNQSISNLKAYAAKPNQNTNATSNSNNNNSLLRKSISNSAMNSSRPKKVRLNVKHRQHSIRNARARRKSFFLKKEKQLMKRANFFSVQNLINNPPNQINSAGNSTNSGRKLNSKINYCCKKNFNLYKDLNNQVIHVFSLF